ncbi:GMP synthase (glutamine-hydrolysing) [Aliiruegeria haliotis]|uniref:GMP synthase (Glutamine-hydrolysing) n=1 Tax=Aliiruegeria haliotis TaxID=1280846 RepID=A0A2T0RRF1_9RHOB|nr:type 1 glutamine amidotransferase [Aliiruegeria haliotis]PRY23748.1 GMP synthase (glutamine-hydrolysing) [Aliiruegeria haliotis]
MRIGILQSGHFPEELVPETGTYPDMYATLLDGHGFTFQTWSVVDGVFPDGIDAADGWLVSGSRHGAYEDHDWIPPLEEFIRTAHAARKPMVGICFGHQIIAQALGGKVIKFPSGWSVGPTQYDFGGETVALNAWHQDQVVEVPEGARVLASTEFCANAALAYGDTILTIQPHPEFGKAALDGLLRTRGHLLTDELLDRARNALDTPTANRETGRKIGEFFLRAREV